MAKAGAVREHFSSLSAAVVADSGGADSHGTLDMQGCRAGSPNEGLLLRQA